MNKVRVLPEEVVSRISAGEVVERPASVVKELVENSLDAGATVLEVDVETAGRTLVRVKDNGSGIEPDDLDRIFLRHATSKIRQVSDLYTVATLGFRGEALYSIAAVSDVILRSKTDSSESGWEVHLRGGKLLNKQPVSMMTGTEVEVRELFFNTPARRKFLKSDTTELNQIINIFIPYVIVHHTSRFRLVHNDRPLINLVPDESLLHRISRVLNLKMEYLLEAESEFPGENLRLHAVLGDINIQQARRDLQFVFINGRPVQSRSMGFAMNQIYRQILPDDTYPFFSVFLQVPAEEVDVNVHPTKREVKLNNEAVLVSHLRKIAETTLLAKSKPKQATVSRQPLSSETVLEGASRQKEAVCEPAGEYLIRTEEQELYGGPMLDRTGTLRDKLAGARYAGNVFNKYLLFDTGSSMLIIDQHAAHERIIYERFRKQIETRSIEVQNLLTPTLVRLGLQELLVWEEGQKKLEEIGFSTTAWDKETIAIHSHPVLIRNPEAAVKNLLADKNLSSLSSDQLARQACRKSVMAGEPVKEAEALSLRDNLLACAVPFVCPHGRPTVVEYSQKSIDHEFLRP